MVNLLYEYNFYEKIINWLNKVFSTDLLIWFVVCLTCCIYIGKNIYYLVKIIINKVKNKK